MLAILGLPWPVTLSYFRLLQTEIRSELRYNEREFFRHINTYKECLSKVSFAVGKEKYDVYYFPHTAQW